MGVEVPCPWYSHGYCTSPKLDKPSVDVVFKDRCLSDSEYKTCSLYVEINEFSKKGIEKYTSISEDEVKKLKPYPLLHYLNYPPKSNCEYIVIYEHTGYYLAYCKVLDRLLARHEVKLCEMFFDTCPIRKYAASMLKRL